MTIHDDILAAAASPMLDLLVELCQRDDTPASRHLIPATFDWFATYTEWTRLGRHLLREADAILADARAG
jgi:hypothetical protein